MKIRLKSHQQRQATRGANDEITDLGAGIPWRNAGLTKSVLSKVYYVQGKALTSVVPVLS